MRIAKYGHSCVLAEFPSGERVLVDPGNMSSIPDEVLAGRLDAVLVTHSHADHVDPKLLERVRAAHPDVPVYAGPEVAAQVPGARDHQFTEFEVGAVRVEVLRAAHEAVLGTTPANEAYRIGGELVVTGDSLDVSLDAWRGTRVLALVAIAPWASKIQLANLVDRLQPQVAFPVHDGFVLDGFRARSDEQLRTYCGERGVTYVVPGPALAEV